MFFNDFWDKIAKFHVYYRDKFIYYLLVCKFNYLQAFFIALCFTVYLHYQPLLVVYIDILLKGVIYIKPTLYDLRKQNKYTAVWLAKQLNISRQQYYNIENKKADIYPDIKIKLASLYNLSVSDIKF